MINQLPVFIIIIPFLSALIIGILGSVKKNFCFPIASIGILVSFIFSIISCLLTINKGTIFYALGGWSKEIGIEFYLNSYNSLFLSLINFVALSVIFYSRKIIALKFFNQIYAFYALILFFITGSLGIVITGDVFNLYVFLEILSLSAYALIALGKKEAYVASLRYLIMGTIGASFYLLGVGFIYLKTGSLNMRTLYGILPAFYNAPTIKMAFILIMSGLCIKMAFFPFHSWLPFAYSKTIEPVSTLMAPIVTKVSLFILMKIIILVFGIKYITFLVSWQLFLPNIAGIGMIYFSIKAFSQKNLKVSFCYVLLMEVSLMFGGIWLVNDIGFSAVLYHIIIDMLMTLSLFLFVMALRYQLQIVNIDDIDNFPISRKMPIFVFSFIITSISVIGIPPTAGFFSKFYFLLSALKSGQYFYVVSLLLSSLILFSLFLKIFEKIFFAKLENKLEKRKISIYSQLPIFLCALFILFFGIKVNSIFENVILPFLG